MKKVFFILSLSALLFSCQKESIETSEQIEVQFQKSTGKLSSCTLLNTIPISGPVRTLSSYPSTPTGVCTGLGNPCFAPKLALVTETEVFNQSGVQSTFNPSSSVYSNDEGIFLYLSEIIDVSDIYPNMSASKANAVYEAVTCAILEEISFLPSLPSGQGYRIDFSSLEVSPALCGCDWFVNGTYDILVLTP